MRQETGDGDANIAIVDLAQPRLTQNANRTGNCIPSDIVVLANYANVFERTTFDNEQLLFKKLIYRVTSFNMSFGVVVSSSILASCSATRPYLAQSCSVEASISSLSLISYFICKD